MLLDASALLAILLDEAGSERILDDCRGSFISTVNLSEVIEKVASKGGTFEDVMLVVGELDLQLLPFSLDHAREAARLKPFVKGKNVSLADRACIAVARCSGLPVLTGDRAWSSLDLGIDIRLIR